MCMYTPTGHCSFCCIGRFTWQLPNSTELWFDGINLPFNIKKRAIAIYPQSVPVKISILYRQDSLPQVNSLKYLGVFSTERLNWGPHVEHITSK